MKYETYQLIDICRFIDYRGKTPPKTTYGIPLITAKIIKDGFIQEPQEFIEVGYYDEWMRRGIPQKGDVIFTTEAPMGEVAILNTDERVAFAQRIIIFQPKSNMLHYSYLYYALKDNKLKGRIGAKATGTTVVGVKSAELKKVEIDIPPLPEQKAIAAVLSALDDKIELNNKINKKLVEMAQAIFKSWFVDFGPFQDGEFVESDLGLIPTGWRVGTLSELVNIKYGKDHKKLADGIYPVYGSGGIMRYAEKSLYNKESVLIPRKGTLDNVIYINKPFWSVDTMFFTEMKLQNIAKFIYFHIISHDLVSMNAGSAVPSMTADILNNLILCIPIQSELKRFEDVVSPLFTLKEQNAVESATLANIRDNLLPKLISGEIRVPLEVE